MAGNIVEYTLKISDDGAKVELKKLKKGADDLGEELDKTGKKAKKSGDTMFKSFADVKAGLELGVAAVKKMATAVIDLANAAHEFTMDAVDMINDLGDIGNRSGIAADTIGGLKAAFHASGQEASQVNQVLDVVAKKFGSLSRGSKAAEEAFEKYGVATKDLEGNLRSNNDILLDSMHVIQGLTDTSLRSRAAVELFGVGGQRLSQALGAGDFDKFLEFVNEFGAVAGPKAAKSAALVQDSISLSNIAFEGFREELVLNLGLMDKLALGLNAVMAFFAGLKEVISVNAGAINNVTSALSIYLEEVLNVFSVIVNVGFSSMETGLQGILENIFLVSAGLIRLVLKPIMALLAMISGSAAILQMDGVSDAAAGLTVRMAQLHKALDPNENAGFRTFQAFSVGVAKSMKLFGEITKGAAHNTELASENIEELGSSMEEADEMTQNLNKSIGILNGLLGKIGVPRVLQIGGMAEIQDQIQTLAQTFSDLGMVGAFGDINIGGKQRSLDMGAQQIAKIVSDLAPRIAAIAAVVFGGMAIASKLGKMGETPQEIKDQVRQNLTTNIEAIERGLQVLPNILRQVLPDMFVLLVDALIFGFAKALAEKLGIVVDFLRGIFTREGRQERRQERVTGAQRVSEFMRRLGVLGDIITGDSMRAGGKFIPSARGGIKFTGAEDGLAMLHRGEFVVPESGQMPQAVQRNMNNQNPSVNLVINAAVVEQNAVDELVRMIERRFTTFGQSQSPLFGS